MAVATLAIVLGGLLLSFALWSKRRQRRFLATIGVVLLPGVHATRLDNRRDVTVFLPPDYDSREDQRYPVLYLNDGQDHDALGLRETLARLTYRGKIPPILVVAVPTNHNRLQEYGTALALNAQGLGSLSNNYANFIIEELMPQIDARFSTRPGAMLLGASLGGLSAFDIAWHHPEQFTAVGVMSGSFWWRAAEDETRIDPGRQIAHSMVRRSAHPPTLRLWFQTGTRDEVSDRDGNGVIDAIQDTRELIAELEAVGTGPEMIRYVEVDGGRHDYETWSRVLPDFLVWAFTPATDRPAPRPSSDFRPSR